MRNSDRCQTFRKSGLLRVRNEHNQVIRLRSKQRQCWRKHGLFQGHAGMLTERISPRFVDLDSWSTADMTAAMYEGQLLACAAVKPALPFINAAVDDAAAARKRGGRLVYVGAGTSGRIAIQDGAELRPTYDWPAERLVFVMAGGLQAVVSSVEGAEDDEDNGAQAIAQAQVLQNDVVIGVAAGGST